MRTLSTILVLAALACLWTATPVRADIIDDLKAVVSAPEAEDDPFLPLYELYKQRAQDAEASGDLVNALEYYRITATINRRDREAIRAARNVKDQLIKQAADKLEAGMAKFEAGEKDTARKLLTESLYLNPDVTTAVPVLKSGFSAQVMRDYTIEQGDTLRRIAEKVYGNPGGELLLTRINSLSIVDTLSPGDTIKVPIVGKALSKRLARLAAVVPEPDKKATKPAKGEEATVAAAASVPEPVLPVEEDLMESEAQDTGALLSMAKLQFGRGLFATAVSMVDEILAQEPNNIAATDIRNESYYELANKHWNDGATAESMRMLLRLPKGYKDSAALKKKVQDKLNADSEPLYLAGVKHFLAEDLEKAVEQWELTLQINPYHAKARQDLEKARKLLEAVQGF